MLSLLLLSLVASSQAEGPGHEEIMKNIQKWNDDVACWGRENMLMYHVGLMKATEQCGGYGLVSGMLKPANPFAAIQSPFNTLPSPSNNPFTTLPGNAGNPWVNAPQPVDSKANQWSNLWSNYLGGRTKRQAEPLLEVDEEEAMQKFLDDYEDFKEDWGAKMGNLTCVLTKMNMLDSSLQVNMQLFTRDIWTMMDMSNTLAGQDPEWVQKMIQGYTDCYQIASNWPQQSLDRNPLSRVFGRHMIFFKCSMKSDKKNCYKAQAHDWLTTLYGNSDDFNWAQAGLPKDKYDRAALSVMAMHNAASDPEKFVGKFFNNDLM